MKLIVIVESALTVSIWIPTKSIHIHNAFTQACPLARRTPQLYHFISPEIQFIKRTGYIIIRSRSVEMSKGGDAKVIRHHSLNWNSRNQSTNWQSILKRGPPLRIFFNVDSPRRQMKAKHILRSGSLRDDSRDQQRTYTAFHADDDAICGTFANSSYPVHNPNRALLCCERERSIFQQL